MGSQTYVLLNKQLKIELTWILRQDYKSTAIAGPLQGLTRSVNHMLTLWRHKKKLRISLISTKFHVNLSIVFKYFSLDPGDGLTYRANPP